MSTQTVKAESHPESMFEAVLARLDKAAKLMKSAKKKQMLQSAIK